MKCDCGAREIKGQTLHRPECATRMPVTGATYPAVTLTENYVIPPGTTATEAIQAILGKNPAAVALGRLGGKRRAAQLTPDQRSEAARTAARARWEKPA